MLNIGGVLGVCDSINPDKGKPFDCRVLGVALNFPYLGERIGVPARVGYKRLDANAALDTRGVPVVALAGTCMEAGKTAAACAVIARMRHRGLTVDAFKATGVSLRRDILAMEDAGARHCAIFTDLGIVTTTRATGRRSRAPCSPSWPPASPTCMVFELGDGILGTYGVDAILECPDIRAALSGVILSANDPVAAWGGVKLLRERFGIEPCVVTGPSTDNQVGVEIITAPDGGRRLQRPEQRRGARRLRHRGASDCKAHGRRNERADFRPSCSAAPATWPASCCACSPGIRTSARAQSCRTAAPGEPVAAAFPHLVSAYPQTRFSSQDEVRRILCETPPTALFSAAPHGVSAALIDALLGGRRAGRHAPARGRHFGGLPLRARRRPTRRSTATRTARRSGSRSSPARCRSTSSELTTPHVAHPGCFATAMLLASVPLLAAGLITPDAVRERRHRQHRLGPQARARHAPSAAAQRSVQLQRARAPPRAGGHRLRARRERRRGAVRVRPALGSVRARHPRDAAGGRSRARSTPRTLLGVLRDYYADAPFVRVSAGGAARQGCGRRATMRTSRRSSMGSTVAVLCAIDNLNKGAAGGAMQWMNRLFGLPQTVRAHRAGAGLDLKETPIPQRAGRCASPATLRPCSRSIRWRSVSAAGVWLTNSRGERVLDLYGGHAVAALGYAHPGFTAALTRQAAQLPVPEQRGGDGGTRARRGAPGALLAAAAAAACSSSTAAPRPTRTRSRSRCASPAARRSWPSRAAFHGRTAAAGAVTFGAAREVVRLSAHAVRGELHAAR